MMTRLSALLVFSVLFPDLSLSDPEPDPVLGLYAGAGALLGYCANGGVRVIQDLN